MVAVTRCVNRQATAARLLLGRLSHRRLSTAPASVTSLDAREIRGSEILPACRAPVCSIPARSNECANALDRDRD